MNRLTVQKRIVSVMIEAFQNATKHGVGQPTLRLETDCDQYVIATSNRICGSERQKFTERLLEVNALSENELRSAYLEGLRKPATAKSCGLGLLSMRRKSGFPLDFNFKEIDTLHTYFYLRVRVRA